MLNDEEPWGEDIEIDPELWLQALLAMTADKDDKEALVREIAQKTRQIPEQVERIIDATIAFMLQQTRSN